MIIIIMPYDCSMVHSVYRIDNDDFIACPSSLSGKLLANRLNDRLWSQTDKFFFLGILSDI